jgi:hypothetical protein
MMPWDTFEHRMLADFVREVGGRAYFEVPVSGPQITPGSRTRKIDAVHFPTNRLGECLDFDRARFLDDLEDAAQNRLPVELIEAKNTASRYTIGQAIVAGDLFTETYGEGPDIHLAVLYPIDRIDVALDRASQRLGIRVHHRAPPAPTRF